MALEAGMNIGDEEVQMNHDRVAFLSERLQRRGGTQRRILRATWYLQDVGEDGPFQPVSEAVADEFER